MIQNGSIWFMQSPEGGMTFITFASRSMIVSVSETDVELYDLLAMKHYRVAFSEAHNEIHVGIVSDIVWDKLDYFPNKETSKWMDVGDKEKMLERMQRALYERLDSLPGKYQKIWDGGTHVVSTLLIQNPGKKY